MLLGLILLCFSEALGFVFLIFVALETGLKIDGSWVVERILSRAGGGGKSYGLLGLQSITNSDCRLAASSFGTGGC